MRIAYVTIVYARASHSFIRGEVAALRDLGHEVFTFSVRRPDPAEIVGPVMRAEYEGTEHLLAAGPWALAREAARWALTRPRRFLRCLRLAADLSNPGLKPRLLPFAYLLEGSLLARRLVDLRIDHLHDHFAEGSASAALFASVLSGVPFSFTVHGPDELDRAERNGLDLKAAEAKFVVAITEFARSQIYRWVPVQDWPKVHVVHCGVDARFLRPVTSPPGGRKLLNVGRMVEQKGQAVAIEALAAARAEGIEFDLELIGDGPLRGMIERRVAELGIGDHVILRGWRDAEEIAEAVDSSLALVLPSFAEGLPIVLMEAMGRGRPVITTPVGGIAELVVPGENGWLVAPSSVPALVEALRELDRTDPERLAAMGRAGAAAVAERHDRAVEAAKLVALMRA
jgi:colanic acid/amylovoran biosynthesis glycosyltransferase